MRSDVKLKLTEKQYSRTESGKSWKAKPDAVKTETITAAQHENFTSLETRRFFRGLGGSESVTRGYTSEGYIVVELISCDPARTIRKVRKFDVIGD